MSLVDTFQLPTQKKWVINNKCTGCRDCLEHCPMDAIQRTPNNHVPPYQINSNICVVCDVCRASLFCPLNCFYEMPLDTHILPKST
jgi:formate hydrogenlyase subunit 6/NADH:ubiquinone oxidoreductase subunit I